MPYSGCRARWSHRLSVRSSSVFGSAGCARRTWVAEQLSAGATGGTRGGCETGATVSTGAAIANQHGIPANATGTACATDQIGGPAVSAVSAGTYPAAVAAGPAVATGRVAVTAGTADPADPKPLSTVAAVAAVTANDGAVAAGPTGTAGTDSQSGAAVTPVTAEGRAGPPGAGTASAAITEPEPTGTASTPVTVKDGTGCRIAGAPDAASATVTEQPRRPASTTDAGE